MAEAAQARRPDLRLAAVKYLRLLRGVVLENGTRHIRVVTRVDETASPNGHDTAPSTVDAAIVEGEPPERVHYRAQVELTRRTETAPAVQAEALETGGPPPVSAEEAYRDLLFHGPLFQGIKEITAIGPDGVSAVLAPSSPGTCLAAGNGHDWLVDPVVIDSALQLLLIWGRLHWNVTVLPSRIGSFRQFGPLTGRQIRCEMRILPDTAKPIIKARYYLYGADDRLLAVLEDVEVVGSKSLNRAAGGPDGAAQEAGG